MIDSREKVFFLKALELGRKASFNLCDRAIKDKDFESQKFFTRIESLFMEGQRIIVEGK